MSGKHLFTAALTASSLQSHIPSASSPSRLPMSSIREGRPLLRNTRPSCQRSSCLILMTPPRSHLLSYPPSHCSEGNRRESRFGRRVSLEALGLRWALVHPNRNGGGLQRCGSLNAVSLHIRTAEVRSLRKFQEGFSIPRPSSSSCHSPEH